MSIASISPAVMSEAPISVIGVLLTGGMNALVRDGSSHSPVIGCSVCPSGQPVLLFSTAGSVHPPQPEPLISAPVVNKTSQFLSEVVTASFPLCNRGVLPARNIRISNHPNLHDRLYYTQIPSHITSRKNYLAFPSLLERKARERWRSGAPGTKFSNS